MNRKPTTRVEQWIEDFLSTMQPTIVCGQVGTHGQILGK